nr:HYR domain-containing protein [Saprospiraceae bacterium]
MKKTNFTSIEQERLVLKLKKILCVFSMLGLFLTINSNGMLAQTNCVMSCFNTQVSVDENCEAEITYDMVSKPSGCVGGFGVEVLGSDGLPIPTSPFVNGDHLNQSFTVKVTDSTSQNFCWSVITVEDKMPPQLNCETDTVACWTLIEYDLPVATDNCTDLDDVEVDLLNEVITPLTCDSLHIQRVDRTYSATDASGNTSGPCTKTYYLKRIDMDSIEYPGDLSVAEDNELLCDEDYPKDGNGNPHPLYTGVPVIGPDDIELYPIAGQYCNILVTYTDVNIPTFDCKVKIMRTWSVREWWCSQEIVDVHVQVIEIVDNEGPEVICPPDITVSTNPNGCSAVVFLPPATVSDNCNDIERVDLTYPGGFKSDSNGGLVELSIGVNSVVYTAYDECFNQNSCEVHVTVEDQTPPIAVCKTVTVVSLGSDGKAKVDAEVFDNGSHDECGIDYFEVGRMNFSCGYNTSFGPYLEFSCCDIPNNLIMVVMRVYDTSGNVNECMVEVEVQDKLPATITCPPDITISCQYIYNPDELDEFGTIAIVENLSDLQDPNLDPRNPIILNDPDNPGVSQPHNWGLDGFAFDNCEVENIIENEVFDIGQCKEGTITRTFTVEGPGGPSSSCQQVIYVENFSSFDGSTIVWPDDVELTSGAGVCDPGDLDPSMTGKPTFSAGICDLVAVNDPVDQVFYFNSPNDPSCYKVLRKWKIIDWCQFNNGSYEIWEHTQVIKIINTTGPQFIGNCDDLDPICSYDPDCQGAFVELIQEADDDCTDEDDLIWSYQVDISNDGTFNYTSANNIYADPGNASNEASGTYPLGEHRILWTVQDHCGNITVCEHLFEIINCKQPSPVCYHGLAAELMPMDTSGDGIADWAEIELKASFFDAGSYHSCGYGVGFSFSSDQFDTTRLFDCDSLGQRFVQIWVTDANGNQDYCNTYVIIQDNNEVCPDNGSGTIGGAIAGMIVNEEEEGVENVTLSLQNSLKAPSMTNANGFFGFTSVPFDEDYELIPQKNDDWLNGVSTFDIALIQRHILGITPLTSPYQMIAADVDKSGSINVVDVAELRKLILGATKELPNNGSWRFVESEHQFTSANPLQEPFMETYSIRSFIDNRLGLDFVGVKIGDINNSSTPNNLTTSEERTIGQPLKFVVEDQKFVRGQLVTVSFMASEFEEISGFQGTLMFDPEVIELIEVQSGVLDIRDNNFGFTYLSEGLITTSWSDFEDHSIQDGEVLFEMTFTTRQDGQIGDYLYLGSAITDAEIYSKDTPRPLELKFDDISTGEGYVLYQNRPNPFRDETIIGFRLPMDQKASLSVYDVTGKLVYQRSEDFTAGYNEVRIQGSDLGTSGVLYYRLDAQNFNASRKMIIIE